MQIAGHTMGTPHLKVKGAIELFANLEFRGVEIVCRDDYQCAISPDTTEKKAKELVHFASSHGVRIVCLTPYITELSSSEFEVRKKDEEQMKQCIRLANYLNCKVVRTYGGSYFPQEGEKCYQEKKEIFIQCLEELGKYAQDLNVCLAIENHFNTLTYDATHTLQIVSEINSPAVGILYDQANLGFIGAEEFEEAISTQASRIIHVHVKDFIFKGENHQFRAGTSVTDVKDSERIVISRVLGQGILPWRNILRLLKQKGYNEFLSLEYEKWRHPQDLPPAEIGMKESAELMKSFLVS